MKITSKGTYSLNALIDIAMHEGQGPVPLPKMAQRQGIPKAYLEQLLMPLRRAGYIRSIRGTLGGYRLGEPAEAISVQQVLLTAEGAFDARRCKGALNCTKQGGCGAHLLLEALGRKVDEFLGPISLRDLLQAMVAGSEQLGW